MSGSRAESGDIRLLVSDVDGTMVTNDKRLTPQVEAAARAVQSAGIRFAITSSRPPFGLRMLIEPLQIQTPIPAFNGGLIVTPDRFEPIEGNCVPVDVVRRSVEFLCGRGVEIWLDTATDWFALDGSEAYVDHEIRTIQTKPKFLASFEQQGVIDRAYKLVGVSNDFDLLARCEGELAAELGASATVARSQRYYLDVTHPLANKGHAVERLSHLLDIPRTAIAAIGDGRNDTAMFAIAGLAIAMGNAEPAVQQSAALVTASNEEDGFALAVERWVLPRANPRRNATSAGEGG